MCEGPTEPLWLSFFEGEGGAKAEVSVSAGLLPLPPLLPESKGVPELLEELEDLSP